MKSVAVIGAGIVGASIAYTLREFDVDVTLIDRSEPGLGCSYGNLGAISVSSVVPLAMPGTLRALPRMLLDPEGPLYLPCSYLPRAASWLLHFAAAARKARVDEVSDRLARLHVGAVAAHMELAKKVGVPELILCKGQLHLYPDERAFAADAAAWRLRARHGVRFKQLDRAGILSLEPHIGPRYRCGVLLPDDATILNPLRYVQAICRAFTERGGALRKACVRSLQSRADGGWELVADESGKRYGRVVVAAGAWSERLLASIGLRVPLQTQRGYHAQFDGGAGLVSRSVVLADRKVFLSPMEQGLRAGGTVEIAGLDAAANFRRAAAVERVARESLVGLEAAVATHWMGHRPCMPDSVPVIGQAPGRPGLWLAIGHGHLGMTDSVNTAQRIAVELLRDIVA